MRKSQVAALVGVIVPLMLLVFSTMTFALPDANCNINTPAPDLDPGNVLVPVSNTGEPCYTEVEEGEIFDVDADDASAEEVRIMDGEITGLSPEECRWSYLATCTAGCSVTVNGPGSEANPPIPNNDYRALATQQLQADVYDLGAQGTPVIATLTVAPTVYILYPNTGTETETPVSNEFRFDTHTDHEPNIRLRILSYAYVDLWSKRVEVSLKGSAAQGLSEWSGNMTAWAIGGDDVIPVIITTQTINQEPAVWQVK